MEYSHSKTFFVYIIFILFQNNLKSMNQESWIMVIGTSNLRHPNANCYHLREGLRKKCFEENKELTILPRKSSGIVPFNSYKNHVMEKYYDSDEKVNHLAGELINSINESQYLVNILLWGSAVRLIPYLIEQFGQYEDLPIKAVHITGYTNNWLFGRLNKIFYNFLEKHRLCHWNNIMNYSEPSAFGFYNIGDESLKKIAVRCYKTKFKKKSGRKNV